MSQLIGGQVVNHENGSVAVYAGGRMVLDGTSASTLEVQDGQPPIIAYQGGSPALDSVGGKLGGELAISATTKFRTRCREARLDGEDARHDGEQHSLVRTGLLRHATGWIARGEIFLRRDQSRRRPERIR